MYKITYVLSCPSSKKVLGPKRCRLLMTVECQWRLSETSRMRTSTSNVPHVITDWIHAGWVLVSLQDHSYHSQPMPATANHSQAVVSSCGTLRRVSYRLVGGGGHTGIHYPPKLLHQTIQISDGYVHHRHLNHHYYRTVFPSGTQYIACQTQSLITKTFKIIATAKLYIAPFCKGLKDLQLFRL